MTVPAKIAERIANALKRFQPVIEAARARDVNESDTSMIVTDLLADLCGYDKYSEITRELQIRGTYCDLATRIDNKLQLIVEVKAIGAELRDQHVKQAVDYAANEGVEWTVLTNGQYWKVYRVIFGKPIETALVLDLDLLQMNPKSASDMESLFLLTRESMVKSGLYAYHDHIEATNKYYIAALLLSDPVLEMMRRELRRLSGIKIDIEELRERVSQDVVKRELLEGDKAADAKKKVQRTAGKSLRTTKAPGDSTEGIVEDDPVLEPVISE